MSAPTLARLHTDGMLRPEAFIRRHPGASVLATNSDNYVTSAVTRFHSIYWDNAVGVYVVRSR